MNEKEVAELRRRFRPEKSSVNHVRGCYVSPQGEVVSRFDQSLALMPQEEGENLLNLLRKSLSGSLGRNLIGVSFSTAQVVDSPEHKLLMALRDSELKDEESLEAFFQAVAQSFRLEDMGYLILLAYDSYDVPYRGKDGGTLEDASETVYSYILCSLCPVKETKPVLSYRVGSCSPPLTTGAPTCTKPCTTPRTPPKATKSWWTLCSARSCLCRRTPSGRPFKTC